VPTVTHRAPGAQETDPPEPRTRYTALRLTEQEAHAVRIAIRKIAAARGGYVALAVRLGIPKSTLYHAVRPGSRPSPGLAIRLAAVVGVPVEVLLGGKVVVAHIIGVAA
jgi:DNA-binding phage protein